MDSIYYFIGFIFTWSFTIVVAAYLWIKFWDYNERKYTFAYQVIEVIRIDFFYRRKSIDINMLLAARDRIHNDKRIIFKEWHLNFIEKKIKQHDIRR